MNSRQLETAFFDNLTTETPKGRSKVAFSKMKLDLNAFKKDGVQIRAVRNELQLTNLGAQHLQRIASAFKFGGAGVDLEFSEDMLGFEPEDGLIFKSKNPLWVLEQTGPKSVSIKRVFK